LAELDEVVERNETVAKMKADFEHRLCDLELQIKLLPELKSAGVAGMFASSNPHSTHQHKSDENLTATLAHRLNALETNVDLLAEILTKMEVRTSIEHSEIRPDNEDIASTFQDINMFIEQAEMGADAKPHARSRSRHFQETDSTCFPIAEDE